MIRRYYATKDNTITNAFEENLTTRGTGSNMGASDVLETFSIYNQVSNSSGISTELGRILIQFDISDISSDRSSGAVPASGSVSWYLNMYNAPHSQTVPSSFTLQAVAVSASWEEGYGLDMDFYEDLTRDGVGSNWINRTGDPIAEITKFTFSSDTASDYGAGSATNYVELYNGNTSVNFWFNDGAGDSAGASGTWVSTTINNTGSKANFAADFAIVANAQSGFSANLVSNVVYVTASTAAAPTEHVSEVGTISGLAVQVERSGSNGTKWTTAGGDFLTDASSSFTQTFSTGLEDLSMDVTTLVEQWLDSAGNVLGSKDNNGFGIKLTDAHEAEAKSFFTKKFFGKDSEYFFQRPVLEARWDSSRQDDRGSFYMSSSLATSEDNLNTIYIYNSVRGRLRNIPGIGTGLIGVSIFSSSAGDPAGPALTLVGDGEHVGSAAADSPLVVTGGYVSTGIYSASFAFTGSDSLDTVNDVWFKLDGSVTNAAATAIQYATGTINLKSFASQGHNPETAYVLSMPRLKKEYRKNQTHRLDLYAREKNWSPNIYTVAVQSSIASLIIPSASYQVRRSIDDYVVVPYGTGSTLHTGLSYDVSGNYFDLDTTYLETGYLYEIQYSFYDEENGWEEQPYRFKFRVVD